MGVMMQAFYWGCPGAEDRSFKGWDYVCSKIHELAGTGFTALWLPPVHKAANLSGPSMGYDWECFHPSMYESWDEGAFGDMPDLSHRNPYVFAEILELTRWLVEQVGFDGFRYDYVKGYGANTVTGIQEYRYLRDGKPFQPYGVAEFWDDTGAIQAWVDLTNFSNSNPVDAFDFPLREMLKSLCDLYVMQRIGYGSAHSQVYVLNNSGQGWMGARAVTQWQNKRLSPRARWSAADLHRPDDQGTGADGGGQFYAAPRGFAVYVPEE